MTVIGPWAVVSLALFLRESSASSSVMYLLDSLHRDDHFCPCEVMNEPNLPAAAVRIVSRSSVVMHSFQL
jgi:hypothetical protein